MRQGNAFGLLRLALQDGLEDFPVLDDNSIVETVRLVRNVPPRPPIETDSSIPEEFQSVVLRTLAKSPDDRFTYPDKLLRALEAVGAASDVAV